MGTCGLIVPEECARCRSEMCAGWTVPPGVLKRKGDPQARGQAHCEGHTEPGRELWADGRGVAPGLGTGRARPSSRLSLSPGDSLHLSGLCPEDQVRPGCGLPARGASLRIRGPPLHGGLQALATSSEGPVGGLGHCVMCTPLSPGTEGHLGWGPLTWLAQGERLCVPVATQSLPSSSSAAKNVPAVGA